MTEINHLPWFEKYRPKKLNDLTQDENLVKLFKNMITSHNIPHFLFYGLSGTGKTSSILAMGREIFKEHFSDRVIEFNASDDRGINAVRDKISNEAKKYVTEMTSQDGSKIPPFKIIILDEADSMTDEAQDALRVIIEQYSGVTRFCFICNFISKITDAIKSRCTAVYFKKLSNECMIDKLNSIAITESMDIPIQILNTIINVSNGDMRKAIMLLQNLKYLYDYKKSQSKTLSDMSLRELKYASVVNVETDDDSNITEDDIYHIATFIPIDKANSILDEILLASNIIKISNLAKEIIALGYPVDNILTQLNKAILNTKKISDYEKSKIIIYAGQIFFKMKECGNEYIQLLDYLSCIYGIKKKLPNY